MKKYFIAGFLLLGFSTARAQEVYTMGYEKATIDVVDGNLFSKFEFPGQPAVCGIHDISSKTFYTCDYKTFRYVDADYVREGDEKCCDVVDFDPKKYYGTLTFIGVIEHVEWDSMVVYFRTDKAKLRIEVDEREIDALYEKFYKRNHLGKVHLILRLNTYDTPNENVISYNKNTEYIPKPTRTFTKILRW
jgi:hypothetical protein